MNASRLVKLDDSALAVSAPQEDLRGRWVIDRNGEEIGYIDALVIDDTERKVRFLQIASLGVLGVGEQRFLLPTNLVTRITDDEVVIDRTGAHIVGAPTYDPHLKYDQEYYGAVYRYYGYPPYWSRNW